MSRTRILRLNLHNPKGGRGLDAIVAFLEASGADVLAISECQRPVFDELTSRLACVGSSYAKAPYWANGILTRSLPRLAAPPGEEMGTPTCPYGTRVDYALLGPACPAKFVVGSYRVLPAMVRGITDHDAVSVELVLNP